jgi:hypothetical protein
VICQNLRRGRGTGGFITTGIQGLTGCKNKSSVVIRSSTVMLDFPSAWRISTATIKPIVESKVIINIKSSKVVGLIFEDPSWVIEII